MRSLLCSAINLHKTQQKALKATKHDKERGIKNAQNRAMMLLYALYILGEMQHERRTDLSRHLQIELEGFIGFIWCTEDLLLN